MSALQRVLNNSLPGCGLALLASSVTHESISGPMDSIERTRFSAKVGLAFQFASTVATAVASLAGRSNVVSYINNLNTIAGFLGIAVKAFFIGGRVLFKEDNAKWSKLGKETVIDLAAFAGLATLGVASNFFVKKL